MYLAQVTFRSILPSQPLVRNGDEAPLEINELLRHWWESGQMLSDYPPYIRHSRHELSVMVQMPERASLSSRHAHPRTRRLLRSFAGAHIRAPKVKVLGTTLDCVAADTCRERTAYVLFAHPFSELSAVRCADCFAPVPLYRLPRHSLGTPDESLGSEYAGILSWQRDFRRMDQMWFNSGLGERFAFNQLSRLDSPLNRDGLEVREKLEGRLGSRVYYFHWASRIGGGELPHDRPCPSCGGKWHRRSDVFTRFRHKCDKCRLVAM